MKLTEAVAESRLAALVALRDSLAAEIERGTPPEKASQTAPLARQLRETLREIAELEKAQPHGSIVDEIGNKRDARRAGTAGAVGAARGRGDKRAARD